MCLSCPPYCMLDTQNGTDKNSVIGECLSEVIVLLCDSNATQMFGIL